MISARRPLLGDPRTLRPGGGAGGVVGSSPSLLLRLCNFSRFFDLSPLRFFVPEPSPRERSTSGVIVSDGFEYRDEVNMLVTVRLRPSGPSIEASSSRSPPCRRRAIPADAPLAAFRVPLARDYDQMPTRSRIHQRKFGLQ
jgi:hypothetical protein